MTKQNSSRTSTANRPLRATVTFPPPPRAPLAAQRGPPVREAKKGGRGGRISPVAFGHPAPSSIAAVERLAGSLGEIRPWWVLVKTGAAISSKNSPNQGAVQSACAFRKKPMQNSKRSICEMVPPAALPTDWGRTFSHPSRCAACIVIAAPLWAAGYQPHRHANICKARWINFKLSALLPLSWKRRGTTYRPMTRPSLNSKSRLLCATCMAARLASLCQIEWWRCFKN